MNKNLPFRLLAMASFLLLLGTSVQMAAQDKATLPEKKSIGAKYVPIKMGAAEVVKLQADWVAKLKTKSETKTPMGVTMVLIPPAGEAIPGSYWIGKYEVTQGEWKAVMGSNPSSFKEGNKEVKGLDTSRHPVETVTWFACLEFCNRLGEKEGLKPYYGIKVLERSKETKQITKAEIEILGGEGYRLPTPDEWAHSCRAGSVTDFFFGDKGEIDKYGWVDTNSENRTHAVGEKKPNAFGLHDTHGNVREWALEFITDEKTKAISRARCYGGSFHYKADACGAGSSGRWHGPHDALSFCGLRLARTAKAPDAQGRPAGLRAGYALMVHTGELEAIIKAADIPGHRRSEHYFGTWHGFVGGTAESIQERHRAPIAKGDVDVLLIATWSWFPQREVWHDRVGLDSALAGLAEMGLKNNPDFRICWRSYLQPQTFKKGGEVVPDFATTRKQLALHSKALETLVDAINKKHGKQVVQIVPHADAALKLVDMVADGKFPGMTDPADLWMKEESFNMNVHRHLRALSAYCDFAAMYRVSPVGLQPSFDSLTYRSKGGKDHSMAGITAEQHAILQRISWETVSAYPFAGVATQ